MVSDVHVKAAAMAAEPFGEVYISKPNSKRHFLFESYRAVPVWMFREVSAVERAFNLERFFVRGRLEYMLSVAEDPEHVRLLKAIEANVNQTETIEQLFTVEKRLELHRARNPEWRWYK